MADVPQGAAGDTGLGVPPFRAASPVTPQTPTAPLGAATSPVFGSKDGTMNRAPFSTPSPTPSIPGGPAAMRTAAPQVTRPSSRDAAPERRTLVVGRGISVQGMVQDAERLVVEGQMEASMIHAHELSVAAGGIFKGEIEVEDAEISGTIDGTVTARGNLVVRASGIVLGTARCRRLQVEDGGQITGRIEMINEPRGRVGEVQSQRIPVPADA